MSQRGIGTCCSDTGILGGVPRVREAVARALHGGHQHPEARQGAADGLCRERRHEHGHGE